MSTGAKKFLLSVLGTAVFWIMLHVTWNTIDGPGALERRIKNLKNHRRFTKELIEEAEL